MRFCGSMRAFFTRRKIEKPAGRKKSAAVGRILVDTGSEYTRIPGVILERNGIHREDKHLSFMIADGGTIRFRDHSPLQISLGSMRWCGEKGELSLLGTRTLKV